ncbi:hypothetical protein D3C76_1770570 [compost metagenome]
MILMRMGDVDRLDPVAVLLEPGDIGHDQVDPRRAFHVAEGHAQIDDDQPLASRLAIAVDIGVHADFARAAQRQIYQALSHVPSPC